MEKSFAVRGDIAYADVDGKMQYCSDSFLLVKGGKCQEVVSSLSREEKELPLYGGEGRLVLPGLIDLHAHSSQYAYHGLGGDCELLEWLKIHAFPEEAKFSDLSYARKAYSLFVRDLRNSFTTRACLFATLHVDATLELMEQLEKAKLPCYVGLVEMDQNSPDILRQKNAASALSDTKLFLSRASSFRLEKPILTPRFAPSCDSELLEGLGRISEEENVPVQSHLDENPSEISFVHDLFPEEENYSEVYNTHHLFGEKVKCVMAHCIYQNEEELELLKKRNVYVAHCPESNLNVESGMAPIRKYLDNGIKVGLGSDVSGGSSLNLFKAMEQAMQVSKMVQRYLDPKARFLSSEDVFRMGTLYGGAFFGKAGSFAKGYEADILVIDDSRLSTTCKAGLKDRLERFLYCGKEEDLKEKFAGGERIQLGA
jgi:guanine deaminase